MISLLQSDQGSGFHGGLFVVVPGKFAVVDSIDDGTDEAESAGKQVQDTHSDLVEYEAVNAGYAYEAQQAQDKDELRVFTTGLVQGHEALFFFRVIVFGQFLEPEDLFLVNVRKHGEGIICHV